MYDEGLGVTQDYTKAIEWYTKSAQRRNDNAHCNVDLKCEQGRGVTKDMAMEMRWYWTATNLGNDATKVQDGGTGMTML